MFCYVTDVLSDADVSFDLRVRSFVFCCSVALKHQRCLELVPAEEVPAAACCAFPAPSQQFVRLL